MAAVSAISFCDDRQGSDLPEQKTLRPKIGLGDGGPGADYMFTDLTSRCDSVCMQRDPACKSSAPIYSWVRPQVHCELRFHYVVLFLEGKLASQLS